MSELLDLAAFIGLGAFIFLGLLIPLTALWGEFLPQISNFFAPEVMAAVRMTVFQAGLSAMISVALGVFLAFRLPRDSKLVRVLLAIPFGVPSVVAAAVWAALLPKALSFGFAAVIIAHVFLNVPWVALWISRDLGEVSIAQQEAGATLGASPIQIFRRVTLPSLLPTIVSTVMQVFSLCAMSFILVMILGGGPPVETLETTLFEKIREGGLDLGGASVCAIWQLLITLAPWLVLRRLGGRGRLDSGRSSRKARSSSRTQKWTGVLLAAIFVVPYLFLFRHFSPRLLISPDALAEIAPALRTSLALAATTAVIAVTIALLGVWVEVRQLFMTASVVSLFLLIPSGISVMVLGLGFFIAFASFLDPFSSSVWPIGILLAIFFVPVAFRVFQPIARKRDVAAWEAARTLGASGPQTFFWVEWPRWRGAVASVLSLIAGAAFGEVAAVSLFYNESRVPAALLVSRWMGRYQFEEAQTLSVVLMLISGALILLGGADYARLD
jgi:thiamine transport system permease protein